MINLVILGAVGLVIWERSSFLDKSAPNLEKLAYSHYAFSGTCCMKLIG